MRILGVSGLAQSRLARLHPRYRTPGAAIMLQGTWAILLTLTGGYGELLDYVVFGDWIFFGTTAATLFLYRSSERRGLESGDLRFRIPGYPLTPLIFILAALYVVLGSVLSNPTNALRGMALMALGVPVFLFWKRRRTTSL